MMDKEKKIYVEKRFRALGTDIWVKIIAEKEEQGRIKKDFGKLEEIYRGKERIFSRFDENSELSRLNSALGRFQEASCDILEIAEKSLKYHELSDGLFDPRIIEWLETIGYRRDFPENDFEEIGFPGKRRFVKSLKDELMIKEGRVLFSSRMDFSGLAKGYITDQASSYLESQGWKNFLVDSGGDIAVSGQGPNGQNWMISIEGFPENQLKLRLDQKKRSVATSGITRRRWESRGRRFHHLVNPLDLNNFDFKLRSVSVIAQNVELADFWAKVLFLMGKERGLEFSEQKKIRSVFLDCQGNAYISSEIRNNIIK